MVRLEGIEPPTLGLEVRRSVQLSYRRISHLYYTGYAPSPAGPRSKTKLFSVGSNHHR